MGESLAADDPGVAAATERRARRLSLAAILLVWLAVSLPLALGWTTLYSRDVFTIHLPWKAFGAHQLAHGSVPALNPTFGMGQVFRGNPNAVPLYPDNLLYVVLPFWSAFNLHYVLHWLLALFAMRALARELGQGESAALLGGVAYAGSGWMLANLTLYNLVVVTAWWPLVLLGTARGGRRGLALGGLACGLALLGGEPVTAAIGIVPLVWVAVERAGWRRGGLRVLVVGGLGLLVALPQLVATARVVGFTRRVVFGVRATHQFALEPARLAELLVPLPWGIPDRLGLGGFWAGRIGAKAPFSFTLYFGAVALGLALLASRRRPRWALLAVAGLTLAWLGGVFGGELTELSAGLFRYPEKFLFWFVLATPLLAGWGFEACRRSPRACRTALLLAAAAVVALVPVVWHTGGALVSWLAPGASPEAVASLSLWQVPRWIAALGLTAGLLGAAALACRWKGGVLLILLELVALLPLHTLVPSEATAPFRRAAPWAAKLPPGAAVVSSTYDSELGTGRPTYLLDRPDRDVMQRIGHLDLDYPTGVLQGLTYPLVPELEGMSSPLSAMVVERLPVMPWSAKLNWLRTLGVDAVTLTVPPPIHGLELAARADRFGVPTYLYRVVSPAPETWWPRRVHRVGRPSEALARVGAAPDSVSEVVAPAAVEQSPQGRSRLVSEAPDRIEIEVESASGGLAVVRRAYQPILRAFSGGVELPTLPVNLTLTGVLVPAGRHRVVLRVQEWPALVSGGLAVLAALGLVWIAVTGGPIPRRSSGLGPSPGV